MLKDLRFRFRHDGCWLQETTERHPDVNLVASAIYLAGSEVHMNVTVHAPDGASVEAAAAAWATDARIKKVTRLGGGPRGARFHIAYTQPQSIYVHILQHSPVSMGAIRFSQGVEHYQITGESPDLQELVKVLGRHGQVDVVSIRDVQDIEAENLASAFTADLTDKQLEAIVLAHKNGYYQWPRSASASELAQRLGLSSSAFLDHLRHGEAKLVDAVLQDLAVREPGRIEALRGRVKPKPRSTPSALTREERGPSRPS